MGMVAEPKQTLPVPKGRKSACKRPDPKRGTPRAIWVDTVYNDGSKLNSHPKIHHLLLRTLEHQGSPRAGWWDGL